MESLLKSMMDFWVDLGVDPDRALIMSGLGLIVIGFIAVVLLSQARLQA